MEATGVNVGIIMSCKQQSNSGGRDEPRYQNLPKEHVQILRQNIGTVIQVLQGYATCALITCQLSRYAHCQPTSAHTPISLAQSMPHCAALSRWWSSVNYHTNIGLPYHQQVFVLLSCAWSHCIFGMHVQLAIRHGCLCILYPAPSQLACCNVHSYLTIIARTACFWLSSIALLNHISSLC